MRNSKLVIGFVLTGVWAFALILSGCSGGGSTTPMKKLTAIEISPESSTVGVGATLQFAASGTYDDGSAADITSQVEWSSSDVTLASISEGGKATGVSIGRPKITASSGGLTGATQLLVINGSANNVPRFAFVANMQDGTLLALTVNPATGQLRHNGYQLTEQGPGAVAVEPRGKFVYVANSQSNSLSAFQIDVSGGLTALSGAPFMDQGYPLAIAIDPTGSFLYTANSGSGQVAGYGIDPATGVLQELAGSPFPAASGTNAITIDPTGRFLYVTNGAANSISAYAIAPDTGTLTAIQGSPVPAGNQPFAVNTDPAGKLLYVANAADASVSAFSISASDGTLSAIGGSPFPTGAGPEIAGLTVSPDGKFVYVANFSSSSISVLSVNAGALTPVSGSPFAVDGTPRGVVIDPTGKFAYVPVLTSCEVEIYAIDASGRMTVMDRVRTRQQAAAFALAFGGTGITYSPKFAYVTNLNSDNVSAFSINPANGALAALGTQTYATGVGPFGVTADPRGKFLYVANGISSSTGTAARSISAFSIGTDGTLTSVPGSPFPAGEGTTGIVVDPSGRFLYAANYYDYTVSAYSIQPTTGALTQLNGSPYPTVPEPQAIAVDPAGRFLYVGLNEFRIDPVSGQLTDLGTTIPSSFGDSGMAADPTGKYLYISTQGSGVVSTYTIDAVSGVLTFVSYAPALTGGASVSVSAEPTGAFAVMDLGSNLLSFAIDHSTGELQQTPASTSAGGPALFYMAMDPSGQYVYVADQGAGPSFDGKVWAYELDAKTGVLTPVAGSPFSTGKASIAVAVTGAIQ
jgi:6-phosphogluconolactonase (cycloisomerase 2 family)